MLNSKSFGARDPFDVGVWITPSSSGYYTEIRVQTRIGLIRRYTAIARGDISVKGVFITYASAERRKLFIHYPSFVFTPSIRYRRVKPPPRLERGSSLVSSLDLTQFSLKMHNSTKNRTQLCLTR